ncbi:MAG: DUF4340 domain-containing protein [Planctomycetota bacterium]|nr:DUF4340 domain-containing protein [Planctomycetota bacterium]
MNEWPKTLAFAAVAALTTGIALTLSGLDQRAANRVFDDQGQPLFESFEDPLAVQAMDVIEYNPDTATVTPFKVQQKAGKWSIPSHYDYPAEAKDRLAKTAAGVIDLKKDTIRSDDVSDHEKLGVIDPLDTKTTSLKGRGKRVKLSKQAGGESLADLIIGNEIKDRPGQRFVRLPNSPRTYGVNVNVDLSTRFSDWITQDLLKLDTSKVRKIVIDRHKADPARGVLVPGEVTTLTRGTPPDSWTIDNPPVDKKVDTSKISGISSTLSGLKVMGVRPKPDGLTKDLKQSDDGKFQLSQKAVLSLQSRGFYRTRQGTLVSNQGEIQVGTDQGVVYVLRFGDVTVAQGEALSAGTSDDADEQKPDSAPNSKTDDSKPAQTKKAPGETEGRFLFITARFDPELVPTPVDSNASRVTDLPGDPFNHQTLGVTTPGFEPDVAADQLKAKEKAEKLAMELEKLRAEGRKQVQQLSDRYAGWYYVVAGDAFRSIALNRDDLLKDPNAPPAQPNFPGGPQGGMPELPPGFNLPGMRSPH